ncbi:Uncharacterized protein PECH_007137 [Penicillium ucsense]|uniref:N-acetyltransferase domain-containing protein n=1 Tax=Penicillium ucsense TaxID=2839758 RepID=A0A8J8W2W9_9EURO|nr:Uncharacterized protein PECM_006852 [Penicillium ucsense]KAF7735159.1 Uncharacterized protein PECH_007137 [Penicillium ucsense]
MSDLNPKPTKPDYQILPATQSDCAAIAQVEALSNFHASNTSPRCNPAQVIFPPPDDVSSRTKDLSDKTQNDPSMKMWKVVVTDQADGQEKIVSLAIWHFYPEPKAVDEWKDIEWPANAQGEACNAFIRGMAALRKKHMSGKTFGHLQVLATLPEYRGFGMGSALVKIGLDEGMKMGLKVFWLEASADGYPLYQKFGFEVVEPYSFDLTKYGGDGPVQVRVMQKVVDASA